MVRGYWSGAVAAVAHREEARQVGETLAAVLASHADRATAPESRPSDARLVSLVAWLVPSGPQRECATSER